MSVTKRKISFGTEWFIVSKKTIYKIIGAILAVILMVGIGYGAKWYFERWQNSQQGNPHSARFLRIEGKVTIKHASTGVTVAATQNMSLEPGDTIQTGSDATALVEYEDGSRYTIKPGSTIILRENSEKDKRVLSTLKDGNVKVQTQENSNRHIVDTPVGVKTEVGTNSDVGIGTKDGNATVVVGHGIATLFTNQGVQKITENQRVDVTPEGVKQSQLLPPPILGSPENAKQMLLDANDEIEFVWSPVPDADHYNIMISPTISFPEQALTVNLNGYGQTNYKWHKPQQGSYFWHVQGVSKDGIEGNWSDPANFSVKFRRQGDIPLRITKTTEINFFLIEIEGVTKPGATIKVNDRPVDVDSTGKFKDDVSFPPKTRERTIVIEAQDANGNNKTITQHL